MIRIIIISLLIVLSLFWGIYPHNENCNLLKIIGQNHCPSKYIHIILGSLFYILAIFIIQH